MPCHSLGYSLRTGTAPSGLASNRVTNWDVFSGFQPKLQLHPIVFSHCITSCIGYINQSFYNHLTMDDLYNQFNLWISLYNEYFQLEFIYIHPILTMDFFSFVVICPLHLIVSPQMVDFIPPWILLVISQSKPDTIPWEPIQVPVK